MAAGRRPIAGSASTESPLAPDSTTKSAGPMPSASAAITNSSQSAARASSDLVPFRTHSSPFFLAVVCSFSGSNSGRGSRIARAAAGTSSPVKAGR